MTALERIKSFLDNYSKQIRKKLKDPTLDKDDVATLLGALGATTAFVEFVDGEIQLAEDEHGRKA